MALRVELDFLNKAGLGAAFEVHRAAFSDAICDLFELVIVALSTSADIEPQSLLGERVDVLFRDEPILPAVRGMVRKAQRHATERDGITRFEIVVVPFEWLLGRARRTRIFQALSAPEIAASILKEHGITLAPPGGRLGSHPAREYCVQHEETDRDFVLRLLADEGIASFHDHAARAWVLADDTTSGAVRVGDRIVFNPLNLTPGGPAVLKWAETADVETGAVARRDYDYTKPNFVLQAAEAAGGGPAAEASLEDYDYEVGAFADDGAGRALVRRRREALRATARRLRLETNFAAAAGMRLSIQGLDLPGDWLVIRSSVWLEATTPTAPSARYELIAIPADVPFRPRPLPRPRVPGTQTAFVVGDSPPGTVDTDALGRVKVEFRWDRRDLGAGNPTRWVRVAQAWAGPGHGLVTLPRVGDEVLIVYSEGDPDQPLVIGRVHNAVSVTPLSLPEPDKTKAIWKSQSFGAGGPVDGFNMIMMDDAAGEEALEIKAQLDYRAAIGRDMSTSVGRNSATLIQGDDATEVSGSQSLVVRGSSSSVTTGGVSMYGGTISMQSGGTMKLHAKGDMTLSTDADRTDATATNHFIKASSLYISVSDVVQINASHFHVFATGDIRLICGGSSIVLSPGGIKITASGDVEVNGGLVKLNCG